MSKMVADTIWGQILQGRGIDGSPGRNCMAAWGTFAVRWHPENQEHKHLGALSFKVWGFLFKGIVKVELAYNDTYRIRLLNDYNGNDVKRIDDVYFDQLTEIIDREVEHPGSESQYQKLTQRATYRI